MHQPMWGAIGLSALLLAAACDLVTSPGEDETASDEAIGTGGEPVLVRRTVLVPVVAAAQPDAMVGAEVSEEPGFDDPNRCLPE